MAYNPQTFETLYGFSVLDEIHNFFPELLYDEVLFPSETLQWMRHRVQTLFPRVYVRQQNSYEIYSSRQRLQSYLQWRNANNVPDIPTSHRGVATPVVSIAAPPPPRAATRAAGGTGAGLRTPAHTSVDISGAEIPPPVQLPRARTRTANQLPTLFTSLLWDIREPAAQDVAGDAIMNFFNYAFQDVVVAATQEQIDGASTLRNENSIHADTICSICQEHTLHTSDDPSWRALHCGHVYHRECIDTWLSSHIQCPICRTDIRRVQAPSRPGNN